MTKIKFSTSQFLAALALAAAIGLMVQAINITPASALEAPSEDVAAETSVSNHVTDQAGLVAALADASIATITVDASFTTDANIDINRTVTIDLGGNTITNTTASARLFNITKGNVTIKNGTLEATGTDGATVRIYGSEDASASDYTVVTIVKDVTLKTTDNYGAFISHINHHAYGVKLNFNGTIEGGYGLHVNGFIADKVGNYPQIKIGNDAKINVSGMGVYAAGYAKWTIGGATINAGQTASRSLDEGTGIGAKAGIFELNGTTITATGQKVDAGSNNNGMQGAGAVFQVENNTSYAGDVEITVNGGNYSSANNAVFFQHNDGTQNLKSLKINGGTFKAATGENVFSLIPDEKERVAISGGTFSSDVSAYLAGDWEMNKDANGNWVVGIAKPSGPSIEDSTTPTPSTPSDNQKPEAEVPNTGAVSRNFATNAIASVSLIVSTFVAGGIFYNRFKVYRKAANFVPNPSVKRFKKD